MQSVSQYDTGTSASGVAIENTDSRFNQNFWAFTPANPASGYLNRYHVRFGPAENPSATMREDGLFALHYVHMAAELWVDCRDGWLAVVDDTSRYAMVERFQYVEGATYPGKASVIFWTNGPGVRLSADGVPSLSADADAHPYYLEAEVNSPMCHLRPGEKCVLETEWFPTRAGSEFQAATEAGVILRRLQARDSGNGKVKLSGAFGVFFPGKLMARLYDDHGRSLGSIPVADVSPTDAVSLEAEIATSKKAARVSLHVEDTNGVDRGSFGEVRVAAAVTH